MLGGCLSSSRTDGTEESHHHVSLRSLMAAKQTPLRPSHSLAMEILERKLGLSTRKTLQARTNLLDTACHNLAKAKERALVSLPPSFYLKSDTLLFPLPLPPGYAEPPPGKATRINAVKASPHTTPRSANSIRSNRVDVCSARYPATSNIPADFLAVDSSDRHSDPYTAKSSSLVSKLSSTSTRSHGTDISVISSDDSATSTFSSISGAIPVKSATSSLSSSSPRSPCLSHANSTTTCSSSCEALTPSSCSTSSFTFSAAPSSLSQSSSFSSSSTNCSSDIPLDSLARCLMQESSIYTAADSSLPSPTHKPNARPLKKFSAAEIERACDNFDVAYKLRDGSMGPFYRAYLPEEQSTVAITRVATKLSRKKWEARLQGLAGLAHPNLCKAIGYSYVRGKRCKREEGGAQEGERPAAVQGSSTGLIVYESMGSESLEEFVQDVEKGHSHIDWSTRLKIAIAIAEGLSFLLHTLPSYVGYGDLSMSNITVDSSLNVKLFDFVISTGIDQKERKSRQLVQSLGNVLFKLFDFVRYSEAGGSQGSKKTYPPSDAELVIQLIACCLLEEDSSRPSIHQVARVLRSIEPRHHEARCSLKRSNSLTYRRSKPFS